MYEEIIQRHRPRGYRVRHTRRKDKIAEDTRIALRKRNWATAGTVMVAECHFERKTIYAPTVTDPFTLHILLHEFAHVHLGHAGKTVPRHVEEWEAEQWAIGVMKGHGICIPRIVYRSIRVYMRELIEADSGRGHAIKRHVKRFARI